MNTPTKPQTITYEATQTIVASLRGRSENARRLLQENLREPLVRFCWGYLGQVEEAEDAFQEVCLRVLQAESVPDHFRPWVYKIARNHCINLLRDRRARRDALPLPSDSKIHAQLTGNLTRMARREAAVEVAELFAKLGDAQREVLRLRYVEELSRPEIAEVLDVTESVVKSRLFEGLKTLRGGSTQLQED